MNEGFNEYQSWQAARCISCFKYLDCYGAYECHYHSDDVDGELEL